MPQRAAAEAENMPQRAGAETASVASDISFSALDSNAATAPAWHNNFAVRLAT